MKNNFLGKYNHFELLTYGKEKCLVKELDNVHTMTSVNARTT